MRKSSALSINFSSDFSVRNVQMNYIFDYQTSDSNRTRHSIIIADKLNFCGKSTRPIRISQTPFIRLISSYHNLHIKLKSLTKNRQFPTISSSNTTLNQLLEIKRFSVDVNKSPRSPDQVSCHRVASRTGNG